MLELEPARAGFAKRPEAGSVQDFGDLPLDFVLAGPPQAIGLINPDDAQVGESQAEKGPTGFQSPVGPSFEEAG